MSSMEDITVLVLILMSFRHMIFPPLLVMIISVTLVIVDQDIILQHSIQIVWPQAVHV